MVKLGPRHGGEIYYPAPQGSHQGTSRGHPLRGEHDSDQNRPPPRRGGQLLHG